MVGHRLPKKIDNRSQAEKDKERDYLISASKNKDLIRRLDMGSVTGRDGLGVLAVLAMNRRAIQCCKVDGYWINRFEAETLCTFFFYLNQKDMVCSGLKDVVDFITSNNRQKVKTEGYFKGLIDREYIRAVDHFSGGTRYCVTDLGFAFITRYLYYSMGFTRQSNDKRIEVFLSRMRADLKKMIRAKPRLKGRPLPAKQVA